MQFMTHLCGDSHIPIFWWETGNLRMMTSSVVYFVLDSAAAPSWTNQFRTQINMETGYLQTTGRDLTSRTSIEVRYTYLTAELVDDQPWQYNQNLATKTEIQAPVSSRYLCRDLGGKLSFYSSCLWLTVDPTNTQVCIGPTLLHLILPQPIIPLSNIRALRLQPLLRQWARSTMGKSIHRPEAKAIRPRTIRSQITTQMPWLQSTTLIHLPRARLLKITPLYTANATLIIHQSTNHNQRVPILRPIPSRLHSLMPIHIIRHWRGDRGRGLTPKHRMHTFRSRRARRLIRHHHNIHLKFLWHQRQHRHPNIQHRPHAHFHVICAHCHSIANMISRGTERHTLAKSLISVMEAAGKPSQEKMH